jgi:hypothetical protein
MPIKSKSDYWLTDFQNIFVRRHLQGSGARRALTKFILDHDAGEIGDIGVVYDTAKALLRIPGDFFTVDPIQYGAQIVKEAPHSKRFQILRSAPSMDRIKALLPYRKIHPLLEEFLVSLADQPWLDRIPSEVMPDNRTAAPQANAWLEEYRHHASSDRMQRLVNEWEGTAVAQYQNLAGPLERLLNRAATSLEVIRFGLGLQTDQTDCESLTVLQEGIAKLMQNCEQQQFPGKLRCLLCRLEYTKHKGSTTLPGAGEPRALTSSLRLANAGCSSYRKVTGHSGTARTNPLRIANWASDAWRWRYPCQKTAD